MDIWGLKGLRLGNNFFNCLFLLLYNDSQICCLEVTEVMGVSLHHITGEKSHKPSPIIVKRIDFVLEDNIKGKPLALWHKLKGEKQ